MIFFYLTEDFLAPNQRSGMILEVQIQIFGAHAAKVLFSKNSRGLLNISIFLRNWHEVSLYIKEQMQKNKFEI